MNLSLGSAVKVEICIGHLSYAQALVDSCILPSYRDTYGGPVILISQYPISRTNHSFYFNKSHQVCGVRANGSLANATPYNSHFFAKVTASCRFVARTSVGCQLPESVPKTTGQQNCLRASKMQISGLKEDSRAARVKTCFERHRRMFGKEIGCHEKQVHVPVSYRFREQGLFYDF